MDIHVPMLVITGPVGVGKTAVALEVSALLRARGVAHAVVDLDALSWCYPRPPDDRFHFRLAIRNLADMWRNCGEAGTRRLVVASVIGSRAQLERLREAVPGADVTLVRLQASLPVLLERVGRREMGSARNWHLSRAKELAAQMDAAPLEDHLVETDGVGLEVVAGQVLAVLGWGHEAEEVDDRSTRTAAATGTLASAVMTREAAPGDAEALASIWLDNARYYVERYPDDFQLPREDGLADWFREGIRRASDPSSQLSLVAELSGRVVGFASGRIEPPAESASRQMLPHLAMATLRIDVLGVSKAHWRRGVATALVQALEDWGRGRGAGVAITHTHHDSPVSVPFWERAAGYARRGLILVKPLSPVTAERRAPTAPDEPLT